MTNHCKVYMAYFDYVTQEEIMCEACGRPAVDIHHINGRSSKDKDNIKNLWHYAVNITQWHMKAYLKVRCSTFIIFT